MGGDQMDAISHCTKNSRWKLQGRSALGVLLILFALSLLGWVYLTQASYVATTSRRVRKLESEKARIQEENSQLMAEIADLESVSRLASRAEEIGFVLTAVGDAEFMAMIDVLVAQTRGLETDASVTHWWKNVASQFTAWAQVGTP
jgi:cell division protein FtsL